MSGYPFVMLGILVVFFGVIASWGGNLAFAGVICLGGLVLVWRGVRNLLDQG
ncbi:MAG: hypothetical protein IPL93_03990 [Actinomycetales bacterium]|jgi:hypothetical protein|nr:hypothetical protein [Actinomycetales bacterium]